MFDLVPILLSFSQYGGLVCNPSEVLHGVWCFKDRGVFHETVYLLLSSVSCCVSRLDLRAGSEISSGG